MIAQTATNDSKQQQMIDPNSNKCNIFDLIMIMIAMIIMKSKAQFFKMQQAINSKVPRCNNSIVFNAQFPKCNNSFESKAQFPKMQQFYRIQNAISWDTTTEQGNWIQNAIS